MGKRPVITFLGPSGIGKTTLAKWVSDEFRIPFVSGSYSDLVPSTRNLHHSKMIDLPAEEILKSDIQLLRLRNESYRLHRNQGMVSDRSPLDILAYSFIKLSQRVPTCDLDKLWELVLSNLYLVDIIIYMPFPINSLSEWDFEPNGKRITNKYFQWMVSILMNAVLTKVDRKLEFIKPETFLTLPTTSLEERKLMISHFLSPILEKWKEE